MRTRRRFLIALAAAPAALLGATAGADEPGPHPAGPASRVGLLGYGVDAGRIDSFRQGMRELGRVEGRDFAIENRASEARIDELPGRAAELVRLKVDVIVADSTPSVRAAQQATGTVPIVMILGADPVQAGFVRSLAHPGGNVTGVVALSADLWGKRLQLFRQLVPRLSRVVFLANPANPANIVSANKFRAVAEAAALKVRVVTARDREELERAFAEVSQEAPQGLVSGLDTFLQKHAKEIGDFALRRKLPTLAQATEFVEAGALMSYGANIRDLWKHVARYVDKILKGAKPADLPVEQPMLFELVLNRKTAKALGLTIPPELLLLADRVIE